MSDILVRTGQVVLRRLTPSDLDAFLAYRSDPEVARYQDWPTLSPAQSEAFLRDMSVAPLPTRGDWCQIGIARASDNVLIGDIGLWMSEDAHAAELGISLARAAQGKGIGRAAVRGMTDWIFRRTKVEKIVAITDAQNHAARALLGHLCWSHAGVLGPDVEILGRTEHRYEYTPALFERDENAGSEMS